MQRQVTERTSIADLLKSKLTGVSCCFVSLEEKSLWGQFTLLWGRGITTEGKLPGMAVWRLLSTIAAKVILTLNQFIMSLLVKSEDC